MIDELKLEEIGAKYREVAFEKVLCYRMAQEMSETTLRVYAKGLVDLTQMNQLSNLEIGSMLAIDWGLSVPEGILAKLSVKLVTPQDSEMH